MFDPDAPVLWVLNLVETWQCFGRLFFIMAFSSVVFVGLPMLLCKKFRVSIIVPSVRITLIRFITRFTAGGLVSSYGNLHSLVAISL